MSLARLFASALALCGLALAPPTAAERIRDFAVLIRVEADGSLGVEERIDYDFEGLRRHGIHRDIPVRYRRAAGLRHHVGLDVEAVTDGSGAALPHAVSQRGDSVRIRIGDPDRTVTGVQRYRIRYRVRRAMLFFPEHDELYWNATGTEWDLPIDRASAEVLLPAEAAVADARVACFAGPRGAVAGECSAVHGERSLRFAADGALLAREGLTIVVGIPKGIVREPTAWERMQAWLGDSGILWTLLPVGTFFGMLYAWRRFGRDRGPDESIPVRYVPPEGLTPAEVGTLADERADLRDVTATILDLAVRGHLTIEEIDSRQFFFFGSRDWRLRRLHRDTEGLKRHEQRLLQGLFGPDDEVLVSELRDAFYVELPPIRKALYRELSGPGRYFPTSPEGVRTGWAIGGGAVAVLGFAALASGVAQLPGVAAAISSGGVVLAFSRVMPRRTRRGRRALLEIRGFEEFVRRADADRLERMGGRTVENFEKVLPYAVVLGAADAWAEAFADLYTRPPDWYRGSSGGARDFHPRVFVNRVGQSLGTIGQSLASRPRGSGSSGFGGGGFSGGGMGGGGGGSW